MDESTRVAITANLFPAAHSAVEPWDRFPWHRGSDRTYQTAKAHSSQALAIDVFGTIRAASPADRDHAMSAITEGLGIPSAGPWEVFLEWEDEENTLREKRRSQIDAVALGSRSLVFFECKFTEADGGSCSQAKKVSSGKHKGSRQCNKSYEVQTNPVNGKTERCALSAKGIRYWEIIPDLFDLANASDHRPCPFAGPWFQWMRNLVLCFELARRRGLQPAFVVAYADSPDLPVAEKARKNGWKNLKDKLKPNAIHFDTISFQRFVSIVEEDAQRGDRDAGIWRQLGSWIEDKITRATPGQT